MSLPDRTESRWRDFWNNRLQGTPNSNEDLLRQSANTINKIPVSMEAIQEQIQKITALLQLSGNDVLVDFCCGNGLHDFELAQHVHSLFGIDFAENLVAAAQRLKTRPNIHYLMGNVTEPLSALIGENELPNKFLLLSSLGYLQPQDLDVIFYNILQHLSNRHFRFLISGIPIAELKANFYNTAERVARHLENERLQPHINDGIGRWWGAEELKTICKKHGLFVHLANEPQWNYRMYALVSNHPDGLAVQGL